MGPPGGNSADARSPDARSADAYQDLRPLMFAIAYRMLGSVSEAEDIVQEAFLRYHRALGQAPLAEAGEPDSPKAYLSAVTTRLCIDHVRSARARREAYVGEWLPEPLLTDPVGPAAQAGPADLAEQADSLSMAFLLLLERLSPVERAVFLLHDIFSYGYDETAQIVARTPDNCRQLARRARQHLSGHQPRYEPSRGKRAELAGRFSRPSTTATWTGWSSCSRPMSWSTATAAACGPRGPGRSLVATGPADC
jgi:RNA polymerase sigma-70 factor, ECF subfamily